MCIKAGNNELDSVMNLMAMSLRAVIANALDIDLEEITETSRLKEDLGMDQEAAEFLQDLIADTFDGFTVDLNEITTAGELMEVVVMNEFKDLLPERQHGMDVAA